MSYIEDVKRRKFAGMLTKLDESVGSVVSALTEADMLRNSIIVFTTDNGGPAAGFNLNHASNWPFRGVSNNFINPQKFKSVIKNTDSPSRVSYYFPETRLGRLTLKMVFRSRTHCGKVELMEWD